MAQSFLFPCRGGGGGGGGRNLSPLFSMPRRSARVRSKAAENDSQAEAAPDKPAATDSDQSPKKPKLSKNSAPSKAEPAKKKKTPAKKGSLKKVKILLRALGFVICWMARNEQSFC